MTISNYSAFTSNQDSLREAGCLLRLQHLILHSDRSVKMSAMGAISNLALNSANQKEMERIVPHLLPWVESDSTDDDMLFQVLFTLTNVAALTDWHHQFSSSIKRFLIDLSFITSYYITRVVLLVFGATSTSCHALKSEFKAYVCWSICQLTLRWRMIFWKQR